MSVHTYKGTRQHGVESQATPAVDNEEELIILVYNVYFASVRIHTNVCACCMYNTYVCTLMCRYSCIDTRQHGSECGAAPFVDMGWLRLVDSSKL